MTLAGKNLLDKTHKSTKHKEKDWYIRMCIRWHNEESKSKPQNGRRYFQYKQLAELSSVLK